MRAFAMRSVGPNSSLESAYPNSNMGITPGVGRREDKTQEAGQILCGKLAIVGEGVSKRLKDLKELDPRRASGIRTDAEFDSGSVRTADDGRVAILFRERSARLDSRRAVVRACCARCHRCRPRLFRNRQ